MKYFFIFLIVALIFGIIGYSLQFSNDSEVKNDETVKFNTADNQQIDSDSGVSKYCSEDQCLFSAGGEIVGTSKITGHYTKYSKVDWGEEQVECDAMIVHTENPMVQEMVSSVNEGNSVNKLTTDGKLTLNLNLKSLSTSDRQKIFNSTDEKPIDLTVIKYSSIGTGVPGCYSFVKILKVN